MKLQTMLLPTGEFILIGSNCKPPLPPQEMLDGLKKATGAAAVLIVEPDIEVEDALYDENAFRREPDEVATADDFLTRTYLPKVHDREGRAFSLEFTTSPGDANLLGAITGGADFSPAGLVKSVGERDAQDWANGGHLFVGGADPTIDAEKVDLDEVDAAEPRLDSQTVTVAEIDRHTFQQIPGEFGRSPHTGPQEHVLDIEDLTVSAYEEEARDG